MTVNKNKLLNDIMSLQRYASQQGVASVMQCRTIANGGLKAEVWDCPFGFTKGTRDNLNWLQETSTLFSLDFCSSCRHLKAKAQHNALVYYYAIRAAFHLSQPMRLWYLSHRRPAKAQARLRGKPAHPRSLTRAFAYRSH